MQINIPAVLLSELKMFAYTGLLLITSVNSRFLQVTNEYEGM
jgi:hypothetical protein